MTWLRKFLFGETKEEMRDRVFFEDRQRNIKIRSALRNEINDIKNKWNLTLTKPLGEYTVMEFSGLFVLKTEYWKSHCKIKLKELGL